MPTSVLACLGSKYPTSIKGPARLVMMRPPCIYRAVTTASLDAIHREWATACTASDLVGLQAAVLGGLDVTVLGKPSSRTG